jgi:hypothetical protein
LKTFLLQQPVLEFPVPTTIKEPNPNQKRLQKRRETKYEEVSKTKLEENPPFEPLAGLLGTITDNWAHKELTSLSLSSATRSSLRTFLLRQPVLLKENHSGHAHDDNEEKTKTVVVVGVGQLFRRS